METITTPKVKLNTPVAKEGKAARIARTAARKKRNAEKNVLRKLLLDEKRSKMITYLKHGQSGWRIVLSGVEQAMDFPLLSHARRAIRKFIPAKLIMLRTPGMEPYYLG